jgi:DNA-binding beta-propeller fold protein YncE
MDRNRPWSAGYEVRDNREQLMVACGGDDVIDVVDVPTLAIVDHIPTGHDPEVFEVSQNQQMLYVSNKETSTIQEISIADKIIENEIRTGAEPEGIAVARDGKTLYVTSEISDWVHVVDLEGGHRQHHGRHAAKAFPSDAGWKVALGVGRIVLGGLDRRPGNQTGYGKS